MSQLIVRAESDKPLSKEQIEFNTFSAKISELELKLQKLQFNLKKIIEEVSQRVSPYELKMLSAEIGFIMEMDFQYEHEKFKKRERIEIVDFILPRLQVLVKITGKADLRDLYHKFIGHAIEFGEKKNKKSKVLEIEDEEVFEQFFDHSFEMDDNPKKKTKPKLELMELRSLYTSLVKTFHPDKELDESKKAEKNAIMIEILEANKRQDLHALMSISAKYGMNNIHEKLADTQLKHINKSLFSKIKDLEDAIWKAKNSDLNGQLVFEGSVYEKFGKSEKTKEARIAAEITDIKKMTKFYKNNLEFISQGPDCVLEFIELSRFDHQEYF